jgi:hypothetical protein
MNSTVLLGFHSAQDGIAAAKAVSAVDSAAMAIDLASFISFSSHFLYAGALLFHRSLAFPVQCSLFQAGSGFTCGEFSLLAY